jgi:ABC-type transporter Mla maintaining outer membrane lipid asymmetry ATPase subunit MlaF
VVLGGCGLRKSTIEQFVDATVLADEGPICIDGKPAATTNHLSKT